MLRLCRPRPASQMSMRTRGHLEGEDVSDARELYLKMSVDDLLGLARAFRADSRSQSSAVQFIVGRLLFIVEELAFRVKNA